MPHFKTENLGLVSCAWKETVFVDLASQVKLYDCTIRNVPQPLGRRARGCLSDAPVDADVLDILRNDNVPFRIPVTQTDWQSCPEGQAELRVCSSDFKCVGLQVVGTCASYLLLRLL